MNYYQHLFTALLVAILLLAIHRYWLTEIAVPLVTVVALISLVWLAQSVVDFYTFLGGIM